MTMRPGEPDPALLVTTELLSRAKAGDRRALDALMERYLPRLQRWASGRLPVWARSLHDTSDLVQETLTRALELLDTIEVRGGNGFRAYVRQAVLNRIRDQIRWSRRRPGPEGLPESLLDRAPSPLEMAIGADLIERYERALESLSEDDRQLLHLKVELDFDFDEIAVMTERPTAAAARMATLRALRRLAGRMGHEG